MKKKLLKSALIALAGVGLVAGNTLADPIGTGLKDALNIRTDGGISSVDVYTEMIDDSADTAWTHTASNNAGTTLFLEIAGFKDGNSFGVYDLTDSTNRLQLFAGPDGPSGTPFSEFANLYTTGGGNYANQDGVLAVFGSGNAFGWYLKVDAQSEIYFSDTSLNGDGEDHMFAYQGEGDDFNIFNTGIASDYKEWTQNEYILAWEDLYGSYPSSDRDFTDFVVMVESVAPVPEPTTMLLFGAGLACLAGVARRKKMK